MSSFAFIRSCLAFVPSVDHVMCVLRTENKGAPTVEDTKSSQASNKTAPNKNKNKKKNENSSQASLKEEDGDSKTSSQVQDSQEVATER